MAIPQAAVRLESLVLNEKLLQNLSQLQSQNQDTDIPKAVARLASPVPNFRPLEVNALSEPVAQVSASAVALSAARVLTVAISRRARLLCQRRGQFTTKK